MKKVLFLMPALFLGGAETQFRHLISGFNKKKYDISVLTLDSFDRNSNFIKENPNTKFECLNFEHTKTRDKYKNNKFKKYIVFLLNYFKIESKLIGYFRKERYDIVIVYSMFFAPLIPLLKILGAKVIYSERTAQASLYNKKFLKIFYKMSDVITCNSDYTKQIFEEIGINDVKVIYNGIKANKVGSETQLKDSVKNIYLIGRIDPVKNQLLAIKALKNLKHKELFMVGKIQDQSYYNLLTDYIEKNGLKDRTNFINFTENIRDVYNKADLIVLPSYEEGMANVILESFLYKRYCIASNIPTNAVLMKNNKGGVCDPNDENSLVRSIIDYEKLPYGEKNRIVNENYDFTIKNFTIEALVCNYERLIDCI